MYDCGLLWLFGEMIQAQGVTHTYTRIHTHAKPVELGIDPPIRTG